MRVHVPGDKSLTQRALILSALAEGESRISGLLWGGDAESTANALRSLGAGIPQIPSDRGEITVQGVGLEGLLNPGSELDLGNSGTGARLLLGVLSGSGVEATMTGDESLRSRPMLRVTEPLSAMGAGFDFMGEAGRLPVHLRGKRPLEGIDWSTPVASAQVKSSILLAGLTGGASVLITEPEMSRDHTERLFHQVGVSTQSHAVAEGWRVELRDPARSNLRARLSCARGHQFGGVPVGARRTRGYRRLDRDRQRGPESHAHSIPGRASAHGRRNHDRDGRRR